MNDAIRVLNMAGGLGAKLGMEVREIHPKRIVIAMPVTAVIISRYATFTAAQRWPWRKQLPASAAL